MTKDPLCQGTHRALMPLAYASSIGGIGGQIKTKPEDFVVEEILPDGTLLQIDNSMERVGSVGDFTRFVLQKRYWTTQRAIERIARALRIHARRFSYAGSKDRVSISTQLASVFRVDRDRILALSLKDIKILDAWPSSEKVRIGELLGNRFTITVRGVDSSSEKSVLDIYDDLDGAFPNYFGRQRFGAIRGNTHRIGEQILRERYDLAAMSFLCDSNGEAHSGASIARRNLRETGDIKRALVEFPKHLGLERTMLEYLEKHPKDYANAFRGLPRGILLLFMHAFQSYVFNMMLSERIAAGEVTVETGEYYCKERLGFPDLQLRCSRATRWIAGKIIGYETELNERERTVLERYDLEPSDFKIRGFPELSSKGTYRLLFSPFGDFSFKDGIFRFSLPAGSYATVALRELLDKEKRTPS